LSLHPLSLHDALPISVSLAARVSAHYLWSCRIAHINYLQTVMIIRHIDVVPRYRHAISRHAKNRPNDLIAPLALRIGGIANINQDRKSTRLSSSHVKE